MVLGLTNLTWITAGFGWVTVVAPTLVAAPLYFSGKVSFGGLMMAAAAFTQAQSSLRWFVDNFSGIADWRATLLRVTGLRQVLSSEYWNDSRVLRRTVDETRDAGGRPTGRHGGRRHSAGRRGVRRRHHR